MKLKDSAKDAPRAKHLRLTPLEVGSIPSGWDTASISDVAHKVTNGFVGKSLDHQVESQGILYLQGFNIRPSRIDIGKRTLVSSEFHRRQAKSSLKAGDVLVVQSGHIGTCARVPDDFPESNCHALIIVDPKRDRLFPDFLVEYLNSDIGQSRLRGLHVGSSVLHINTSELAQYRIPLPPLAEQHKISEILTAWDGAIEKADALIRLRKKTRAAVYQNIFEGEYTATKNLQRARNLFTPISERARPDLPLLAVMQDLGVIRRDELDRRVTMPDGDTSTYKVVCPGDFVVSLRSFEGGLEYSNVLGLVSPAYTVLRPKREICAGYYKHFFKSQSFIGRLDRMIFGIRDGKQIAFRDFGDMLIPYPRMDQQRQFESILEAATMQIEITERNKRALERQKRGLTQKLLMGEWRVAV